MPPKERRMCQPNKELKQGKKLDRHSQLIVFSALRFMRGSGLSTSVAQTSQFQMNRLVSAANQIALLSSRAQGRGQACAEMFKLARIGPKYLCFGD